MMVCTCWLTGQHYMWYMKDMQGFSVAAILKFLMAAITRTRWCVLTFCMSCYTAGHQYTTKMSYKYSHVDQSYNNFEFSMAAILKLLNGGYHKNQVICPYILFDLLHSWPSIHNIVCKYSHVDQRYSNFEFSVVAILIFLMEAISRIRWYVLKFGMICYTAGNQYTNFHANIHIYTKVIAILSFQWRPFENSKWQSSQEPRTLNRYIHKGHYYHVYIYLFF